MYKYISFTSTSGIFRNIKYFIHKCAEDNHQHSFLIDERFRVEILFGLRAMGAHGALNAPRGSSGLTICQVKYLEKKGHYDQAGNMGAQQLLRVMKIGWSLQISLTRMGSLIQAELYYWCCLSRLNMVF